ncbi:hypothetical protein DFH08DRAFT_827581 [Mycena albidolilacea]|uniref:Uncharacterized protein n=1 Tax=Mycena albidolilacea TaxID=1033008 RepID=A0AAD7E6X8_9AGAR|nr:hypothetical protein DFH08DRAFT_827581 [Mycena albidolilacea]
MATYTEPARPVAPGMERGYAMSPMAELERNYASHSENEASLFERSTSIASKCSLDPTDVLDRGVSLHDRPVARFSLETGFLIRTEKTIKDMNALLSRSSALVPGRTTFFLVDPQYSFLRVLKSAGDLNQLLVAWHALSTRMGLAQRSFTKYQEEFRATTKEEMPLSPVSTAPEIYTSFPVDGSPITDVNYLYDNLPHLQSIWPPRHEPGKTRVESAVEVPPYLLMAFPDRFPEDRPTTYYYLEDGTRMAVASSVRSSHGAGPNFVPPPPDKAEPSRRGRSRAKSGSPVRGRKGDHSQQRKNEPKSKGEDFRTSEPAKAISSAAVTGLLSPDTRFKKPEDVLIPSSPRDYTFASSMPGIGLPDPLKGMASSSQWTYEAIHKNESASQAQGGKLPQRPPYKPTLPTTVDAAEEDTFHRAYISARRDPPPHLPPASLAPTPYKGRPTAPTQSTRGRQGAGAGGDGEPPDDDGGDRDRRPRDRSRGRRQPPPITLPLRFGEQTGG